MTKLKNAGDEYRFNTVRTLDGRIMVMEEGSTKAKVIYRSLWNQWLCCVIPYGKRHSFGGFYLIYFRVIA